MLVSMTGFGKAQATFGQHHIIVEVRSLNSQKGIDLTLKFSTQFHQKEFELRNQVSERLQRGKVDVYVTIEREDHTPELFLNREIVKVYYKELKSIADELGAPADQLLTAVLSKPEVLNASSEEANEEEWATIEAAIHRALDEVQSFRENEGRSLAADIAARLSNIEAMAKEVTALDQPRIAEIKNRLETNIESAIGKGKLDPNRLEQELIFYIEKLDINEELSRLRAHCIYFRENMQNTEPQKGRKLNFISQEIGREINTLGAKANHAPMQKLVVGMKDELEKIKEQINNVL
ncbi:MAG: YicC/YloC family endoribonuclease [Chitinophagales bacterium]